MAVQGTQLPLDKTAQGNDFGWSTPMRLGGQINAILQEDKQTKSVARDY